MKTNHATRKPPQWKYSTHTDTHRHRHTGTKHTHTIGRLMSIDRLFFVSSLNFSGRMQKRFFVLFFFFFSCRVVPLTSLWPTVRHEEEEVDAVISTRRRLKLITAKMRLFTSVGSDFWKKKLQGRWVSGGMLTGKKEKRKKLLESYFWEIDAETRPLTDHGRR